MPGHHDERHPGRDDHRPDKKGPGKGPKEKEIAAALTAATVALAANVGEYANLEAAGDAVARVYTRMTDLVSNELSRPA